MAVRLRPRRQVSARLAANGQQGRSPHTTGSKTSFTLDPHGGTVRVTRSFKNNVDPRIAAVAIVLVLAAVQYVWWRGLVMKPHEDRRPPPTSGGGGAGATAVLGRSDVIVQTVAGAPDPGYADGMGRDARFDGPSALALDARGNLYVADTRNNRIRMVAPNSRTSTLAGSGAVGYRDGDARDARFNAPSGIAVGTDGAVYVADTRNNRIRCIRGGQVSTLAGGPPGFADGPAAAARLLLPTGLAVTAGPNGPALLVADSGNRRIRLVTLGAQPVVTTLRAVPGAPLGVALAAGPPEAARAPGEPGATGHAVAVADAGLLLPGSGAPLAAPIAAEDPDQGTIKTKLELRHPVAVAAAQNGWFATDAGHAAVFRVHDGEAEVYAGVVLPEHVVAGFRDGTGDKCAFGLIAAVAADDHGHVYVADTGNNAIRRLTLSDSNGAP